jgi:hypothetical protein
MKRLLIASALFGFAFAAQAQSSATVAVEADAGQPAATMQAEASSDVPLSDRNCLRETGSLITASQNAKDDRAHRAGKSSKRGDQCANANGRAYTREDIDRTGEVDLADALRRLDPSIR